MVTVVKWFAEFHKLLWYADPVERKLTVIIGFILRREVGLRLVIPYLIDAFDRTGETGDISLKFVLAAITQRCRHT